MDVQNAVQLAQPQLPDAVRQNGITIVKANSDILAVVALTSTDPRYDAPYLTNYLKLFVEDELKRVPGVGNAQTFGGLQFSMLLQLDPSKMARLGITVGDVATAVREQNTTNPAGRIGREPAPPGTELTIPVTTLGRLETADQFNDIVVRALPNGSLVRVRDIGRAVLGAQSYDFVGRLNGQPTAFMLLFLRPGSNALGVRQAVEQRLNELASAFPKGIGYSIPFDTTPFVTASIKEVVITLLEAMILVALVVFLFLQSWRATLIPMLAVPVSVDRHLPRPAAHRLLDQRAHAVRPGAGDRHRGGRRDRGDRERRAHHGDRESARRGLRRTARSARWRERWSRSCCRSSRCSSPWASRAA